jgi:hypothetical protein
MEERARYDARNLIPLEGCANEFHVEHDIIPNPMEAKMKSAISFVA